ncbi:MAG TPA: hypothetical protein VK178_01035 [Opitutaceae bacterium]|nr:hypothetical protein [Opitutaceae bacterium]
MTPQPNGTPPSADHPSAVATSLRERIRDRWGRDYILQGTVGPTCREFTVLTTSERPIGHLVLDLDGDTGELRNLHIADEASPRLPPWLRRALVRFLPNWSTTGHRGRGLGALLVIYALRSACDLKLRAVLAAAPLPADVQNLLRDLGFVLRDGPAGVSATYQIASLRSR